MDGRRRKTDLLFIDGSIFYGSLWVVTFEVNIIYNVYELNEQLMTLSVIRACKA